MDREYDSKRIDKASRFSFSARAKSFRYAWSGVMAFFKAQHNAFIHLFFTVAVIVVSFVVTITRTEAAILVIVIGITWTAELINTAIEAIMDHLSPEIHPAVKKIKDLAAAAVLMAALTAIVTGALIFIPKIF